MNVVVTGGAGFIGSHLVERLVYSGHKVTALDNLSSGKIKNLKKIRNRIKFYKIDLAKEKNLEKYFKNVDWIFHLAGVSSVTQSLIYPIRYYSNNVKSTINLLNAIKYKKVKKIVFFSTAALYGNPKKLPINEKSKIQIFNNYSLTKKICEEILEHWWRVFKINTIILRVFNVYGPRCKDDSKDGNVVGIFYKKYLQKKALPIFGNGKQTRDFIYISDVLDAIIKLAKSKVKFDIFNLGSGKQVTINKLVGIIGVQKIKYLPKNKNEIENSFASIKKLKKTIDWKPLTKIEKGIKETFNSLI